ncbi:hypothetical protein MNBD_GAMMA13-265 [hydrothermal vent metagenome]|uniref:Uncharacterized protein n=1 Tax=hydrothermal vent metagenome TaxID=652676 RepID=A0A3B0Z9G3_9ZZZZ
MNNTRNYHTGGWLASTMSLCMALPLSAEVKIYTEGNSGLLAWKAQHPGFSLQFIQLLPDYVRAIYSARGLPKNVVEHMASYCVFGTIIKNESTSSLAYRVADWRYITRDGHAHPIKTKTQWLEEWQKLGVAFRWSLLPDDQRFAPGDWSQGFTTLPLSPGTTVDLQYSWTVDDKPHKATIEELRCAPETAPKS